MDIKEEEQSKLEYQSWQKVMDEFCELLGITRKEVNQDKYRKLFRLIDQWGDENARLRAMQLLNSSFNIIKKEGTILNG